MGGGRGKGWERDNRDMRAFCMIDWYHNEEILNWNYVIGCGSVENFLTYMSYIFVIIILMVLYYTMLSFVSIFRLVAPINHLVLT